MNVTFHGDVYGKTSKVLRKLLRLEVLQAGGRCAAQILTKLFLKRDEKKKN
jgi:hypothetical protein